MQGLAQEGAELLDCAARLGLNDLRSSDLATIGAAIEVPDMRK
jgi:hypothetical protein